MANNLVKVIIAGAQVVGRAFTKAVRREINESKHAAQRAGGGKKGKETAANSGLFGMSLDEAKQILNVPDGGNIEQINKSYDHLMKVNDKASGGSLYLQSKVYRAKERLDVENQTKNDKTKTSTEDTSGST